MMNRADEQEVKSPQGDTDMMDVSHGVTDLRAQEEEEEEERGEEEEAAETEKTSVNENGMECSEPTGKEKMTEGVPVKTERVDEAEDEPCIKSEEGEEEERGEGDPLEEEEDEEERDGGEEDEEDEERNGEMEEEEEEDGEGEEEGDTLNEPQDLSMADYIKYEDASSDLQDTHAAGSYAEGSYAAASYGAAAIAGSRSHTAAGKLNCDVCGLACVSINVLLVHKRSHTGERPFHCQQCGASFTQKGNLLRHIKLHSGEKPFKCPMCSYACRRRDALSGHLRTHSVEKPYKCNHCGRSYKQRSSLEEHRERCHVYIQNKSNPERACEDSQASRSHMGSERALLLDRLASNVAKRKSSMPQKFTGDNGVCLDLSFNKELIHRTDTMDTTLTSPGSDPHHHPLNTGLAPDPPSSHRPYPIPLTPLSLTNGHKLDHASAGLSHHHHLSRPSQGYSSLDSHHAENPQLSQPLYSLGHLLGGPSPHNGLPHPHSQSHPLPMPPPEALRVVRGEGETGVGVGVGSGAVYPCGHCRVFFLDYVMFTIHMGCHGFRDPMECNVCGHRSRDCYEFSSHIARGEHRPELK